MYGTPPPPPAPGGPYGGAWGPRPPNPADAVGTKAGWALGLTIPSVLLCCAPVGIVGIVFALQSMSLAKNHGVRTPARAISNSPSVRAGKRPSDDALMRELKDDLKENFQKASKQEIEGMTSGKLRFGDGIFD